jgi:hypothetical protein
MASAFHRNLVMPACGTLHVGVAVRARDGEKNVGVAREATVRGAV